MVFNGLCISWMSSSFFIIERDIDEEFSRYGRIRELWVARRPAGFAFVEYTDPRDAADAVKGSDGRYLLNNKIRVEISIRKDGGRNIDRRDDREEYRDDRRYDDRRDNYRDTREPYRDPRDTYRDSRDTYRDDRRDDRRDAFPRDNFREERRGPKANPKRTDFRVKYFDLNRSTKWQHIKDHLRELQCIPVYCDTFGDGTASADFNNESDANYVVEKMDGITFDGVVIHAKRDYDHVENGNNGVREEAPQEVVRGRSRSRDGHEGGQEEPGARGRSRSISNN